MNRPNIALPLTLAMVYLPFTVAAQSQEKDPWPEKGDIVYLSAELKTFVSAYIVFGGSPQEVTIAACEPFTVEKYRPGRKLRVKDRAGHLPMLKGDWLKHLHPNKESCVEYYKEHGQPLVQAAWYDFKLIEKPD